MRTVKSEALESLCDLFTQLYTNKYLKKAILSKPYATDEIKSVLSLKLIKGITVLQVETFSKDNKVYHRNIKDNIRAEIRDLFYKHTQINIISSAGDCQYMMAKSGKETVIGATRIAQNMKNGKATEVRAESNNKVKNYILAGDEDFLKKLGVSDENGRVRDRMQSKFRQINKFLEYVESITDKLPKDKLNVYDLCCGKSYLSFAVYHYFKNIRKNELKMICIDLKADVIEYCSNVASQLGFDGMEFICMDINAYEMRDKPHLVISLHACDIATDIVLNKASANGADVILSTPCCHHELNHKINCAPLSFITEHSMLRQKLCDAATDALRLLKLESEGYDVSAVELIDPEDTPKNIMLKAIKKKNPDGNALVMLREQYLNTRKFLLGEEKKMGLDVIAEISHKYGGDARYVLAGGGNTSFKNEENLYIKGSGTALATILPEGFVKMSREGLAKIWNKTYSKNKDAREAEVLKDMMDARCVGEENKRPSVETLLHNLFKQQYVLHVHPTIVNGVTCSVNGKATVEELFKNAIWVEETEPGYVLAAKCRDMINAYEKSTGKDANLLFLQNHGIFFASETEEGIDKLVVSVMDVLEEKAVIKPDLTVLKHKSPETVDMLKEYIAEAYGNNATVVYTANNEVKKLCASKNAFKILMQPMSPDHIVYCKAIPLFIENFDKDAIKTQYEEFSKKYGYLPKIAFAKNVGMFAIGNNEKDAKTVTEVWLDAVKISVYAQNFGGVRHMAPEMVDFIVNWEVESYRSKVAMNNGDNK